MAEGKYSAYATALNAGIAKITTYYNKTSSVPAYLFLMGTILYLFHSFFVLTTVIVFNPDLKIHYFQQKWVNNAKAAVLEDAQKLYVFFFFDDT